MREAIHASKEIEFGRIQCSILKIRSHKQIGPTVRWIHLFNKAFGDQELVDELSDFLDFHGANSKTFIDE